MARRSGARGFKIDIDTGRGSFLPPKGKPVDFAAIQVAVKEAGFELLWLEAQVRGTLMNAKDAAAARVQPAIKADGSGQVFLLIEGKTDAEHEGFARL